MCQPTGLLLGNKKLIATDTSGKKQRTPSFRSLSPEYELSPGCGGVVVIKNKTLVSSKSVILGRRPKS
jgi:hypothetical protein